MAWSDNKQHKGQWQQEPNMARAFGVTSYDPIAAPLNPSAPPCPQAPDATIPENVALKAQIAYLISIAIT